MHYMHQCNREIMSRATEKCNGITNCSIRHKICSIRHKMESHKVVKAEQREAEHVVAPFRFEAIASTKRKKVIDRVIRTNCELSPSLSTHNWSDTCNNHSVNTTTAEHDLVRQITTHSIMLQPTQHAHCNTCQHSSTLQHSSRLQHQITHIAVFRRLKSPFTQLEEQRLEPFL